MRSIVIVLAVVALVIPAPLKAWECSEEELQEIQEEVFSTLDSDQDGAVSVGEYRGNAPFNAEIRRNYREAAQRNFRNHLTRRAYRLDENDDGKLSKEEFALWYEPEC